MAGKFAKLGHLVSESIRERLWRRLNLSWTLPSGISVGVRNFSDWVMYNDIFVDGEYKPAVDWLLASGVENPVVLDVGGNVGLFAMYLSDRWLREKPQGNLKIIGVEGTPQTYAELRKRMQQPVLAHGRVNAQYHHGLAGKRSGEAFISTSHFHGMNSIAGEKSRFGATVPFIDIEKLFSADERIALLKCDIEGAEELFLENYPELLKRVDCVSIELHHARCNGERCVQLLKDAGLVKHTRLRDCLPEFTVDLFERY